MYPEAANKLLSTPLYYMEDISTCFSALGATVTTSRVAFMTFLHLVVDYLPAQTGVLCLSSRKTLSRSLVLAKVTLWLRTLGCTQLAFQCQGPDCYLSYQN